MNNIESLNWSPSNPISSLLNLNDNQEINPELSTTNNQILFIDSTVENYQILIDNLIKSTEFVVLDSQKDGIFQITETLAQYNSLDTVYIVSHGNSGKLFLGNTVLNQDTLSKYESELNSWGDFIEDEGDILLYGCNIASGEHGSYFIEELSQVTDADILASIDITGTGGNWELEAKVGEVETTSIFNNDINSIYQHTLETTIIIEQPVGGGGDDGFDDSFDDDFQDQIDDALSGDDDDDDFDADDFDSFANVSADNLVNLAANGLNFAEVSPDVLATIDFNNIPPEDFQTLRNAGLSLTPLSHEALANINLGVFKGFDYFSQVDLSQTRFDNLTLYGELSTTFVSNANLYDYKSELDIDLGLNLNNIVQLSTSDFQAIDYAFDGDEIFDGAYYTTQGRDLAGANPFTDYSENGWRQDLDPHPLFDVSYYLSNNTDVRSAGAEPLRHYTTIGFSEDNPNRDPHPLFDTSYYNENNTDVVNANKSSLSHFVENGFQENFDSRDPNKFFDSSYYNANNPDVVAEGVNPLLHYIQFGWRESLPENSGGTNPNRDPNALFDTEFYFETHEDVKNEILQDSDFNIDSLKYYNANPLQHYLEFGGEGIFATENRITHPIYEGDNQVSFTTFIDGESEGFEFAKQEFAKLNFELTPREQGGILVASPTLAAPLVLKGIEYVIYTGIAYEIADQLDLPEGALVLYEAFTQTSLYESFSIRLNDLFTGTPPFPGDVIESTPEIESFPRGNTLENLLDLDGRFYTPLDHIDELAENVETFPQRDEILEDLLDNTFVFPDQQVPTGTYSYPTAIGSNWSEGFENGENDQIIIESATQENFDREAVIRQELASTNQVSRARTRNIAYADYTFTDEFGNVRTGTIKSFSGKQDFGDYALYVPLADRVLNPRTDIPIRVADSEHRIFEQLLAETAESDVGIIELYSYNLVCEYCGDTIEKFLEERPEIRIRIIEGIK